MPGGDGTGPGGMGPMTGRAAGYCAGYPVPGFMNPVGGRGYGGWGRGARGGGRGARGGGRGWRNWYYATGMPGGARAAAGLPAWGGVPPAPYGAGAAPYAPYGAGAVPYAPYGAGAAPYAPYAPYAPQATREQELDFLKGQAEYLEDALEGVNKRLKELETEVKSK